MQVEVTSFILSGTILQLLFAGILTSEIVMWKLALKNRYDSAKIGMVGMSVYIPVNNFSAMLQQFPVSAFN